MYIKQIYTQCLAQACYYIESNGEAAIIDPLRDIEDYLELLDKREAKLKYIFETHFHADFVSGHVDLAAKTGAKIVYGPTAHPGYDAYIADDHEHFKVGELVIELLHTPGHTLESSCFVLYDQGKPYCIFTGDTLFIGDVGRPDLVQKVKKEITPDFLAARLYDSLHHKIMTLPESVLIYPGHGAGSACGKHMSKETVDTLGHQKKFNYALNPELSREDFIQVVTAGLTEPPQYFPENVIRNVNGNERNIDEVIQHSVRAISVGDVSDLLNANSSILIIDARSKEDFCKGHIPGSLFIGLADNFAPWVGTLVHDLQTPIILITETGREKEAVIRLSRVGYDHCLGYVKGGFESWLIADKPTQNIDSIDPTSFVQFLEVSQSPCLILDVRRENEYQLSHLNSAVNIPLHQLEKNISQCPKDIPIYVHCAGGYRSVVAISILQRHGYTKLVNILGGYNQLKSLPVAITEQDISVLDI